MYIYIVPTYLIIITFVKEVMLFRFPSWWKRCLKIWRYETYGKGSRAQLRHLSCINLYVVLRKPRSPAQRVLRRKPAVDHFCQKVTVYLATPIKKKCDLCLTLRRSERMKCNLRCQDISGSCIRSNLVVWSMASQEGLLHFRNNSKEMKKFAVVDQTPERTLFTYIFIVVELRVYE